MLLIVFGSIFGLVALAFVAFCIAIFAFGNKIVHDSNDGRHSADVAAKIATFRLPPGYRYALAMDALVTAVVDIEPTNGSRSDFRIQLQSVKLPTIPGNASQIAKGMEAALKVPASLCSVMAFDGDDRITTEGGKSVVLHGSHCEDGHHRLVAEIGPIPGNAPFVALIAFGSPERFDRAAVHALVRSLR